MIILAPPNPPQRGGLPVEHFYKNTLRDSLPFGEGWGGALNGCKNIFLL
ncbi:MAG: hypothetical protein RLZZ292_810 [Bacteroidota bacterium]|jgi:hypothetical protein